MTQLVLVLQHIPKYVYTIQSEQTSRINARMSERSPCLTLSNLSRFMIISAIIWIICILMSYGDHLFESFCMMPSVHIYAHIYVYNYIVFYWNLNETLFVHEFCTFNRPAQPFILLRTQYWSVMGGIPLLKFICLLKVNWTIVS